MLEKKKIKVFVLDDSEFFCEMISMHLKQDELIEIVGIATDAISAFGMIEELQPDVLTVDIEMPGMDGIEFTREMIKIIPIPIVILSAIDYRVFEAMEAGAVDFVLKPDLDNIGSTGFMSELLVKIRIAAISKVAWNKVRKDNSKKTPDTYRDDKISRRNMKSENIDLERVIGIGASTGGIEAITQILKALPEKFPPILIAQHIPEAFSKMFAVRTNEQVPITVKEAADGEEIKHSTAYVAPGNNQMTISKASGKFYIRCEHGVKHNGFAPSVDVLFNSIKEHFGKNAVGIILTGMGSDGTQGLMNMRASGAYTIGQDEETSVIYGMPGVAYRIGAVQKQLPLINIPMELINVLQK